MPAVTVKPPVSVTTSVPVVSVTLRAPAAAAVIAVDRIVAAVAPQEIVARSASDRHIAERDQMAVERDDVVSVAGDDVFDAVECDLAVAVEDEEDVTGRRHLQCVHAAHAVIGRGVEVVVAFDDVLLTGIIGNDNIDGGPGNDILHGGTGSDIINGGSGDDMVYGDAGDDTLVYTLSENIGAIDNYDGGTGFDYLVLRLTAAQANMAAADIAAAQAFITAHYDPNISTGPSFTFSTFGLTFSNIEAIGVVITGP